MRGIRRPFLTTRVRVVAVAAPYLAIFYALFFAGMDGADASGLAALLLATGGLFVVVQATWLRGRLSPTGVMLWNPLVLTALGAAFGATAEGETADGTAYGIVVGLVVGLVTLWLGSLVQLTRRPRVFLSYRRADSGDRTEVLYQALAKRYRHRNVFRDVHTMRPGTDFRVQIADVAPRRNGARCDSKFSWPASCWRAIPSRGRRIARPWPRPTRRPFESGRQTTHDRSPDGGIRRTSAVPNCSPGQRRTQCRLA